jgi:hypothetical protein
MVGATQHPRARRSRGHGRVHGAAAETGPTWAPDQLSVWPVGRRSVWLGRLLQGATGAQRAEYQAQKLSELNLRATVQRSASAGTTLRLGPLTHEAAWVALEAFLGRPPPRAPGRLAARAVRATVPALVHRTSAPRARLQLAHSSSALSSASHAATTAAIRLYEGGRVVKCAMASLWLSCGRSPWLRA